MYQIVITKTVMKETPASQAYERIRTDKQAEELDESVWGYVTKPAHEKEVSKKIYEQEAEEIDLLGVIAAINGVSFK